MRRIMFSFLFMIVFSFIINTHFAYAVVLVNEFLADPPKGITGDVNQDGVSSSKDDEFVEIVNFGETLVDISGWYIKDKTATRHTFELNTAMLPYESLVVFGGGLPTSFNIKVYTASSGSLSLNNGGDNIMLFDSSGMLVDSVIYGSEGGKDQSLSRYPDGSNDFALHSSIPEAANSIFSPGTMVNNKPFSAPAVPEPSSVLLFGFSIAGYAFNIRRRRRGV